MNQHQQLEKYAALVKDYSKVLDLSSPKLLGEFMQAIESCLPFAEAIPANARVLDVGSGAGLPAIPISILRPDVQITLCEIRSKRAAFLEQVVAQLKLSNAKVHQGDVQKLIATYPIVTALWLGSLAQIYQLTKNQLEEQWTIMTRKGNDIESEIKELEKKQPNIKVSTKQLDAQRQMVIVEGTHGS